MANTSVVRGTSLPQTASKADLHGLVDNALITINNIVNADIKSTAAIADTKLATISTTGKVSAAALTSGSDHYPTLTAGDILYCPYPPVIDRLPIGTAGQKLKAGYDCTLLIHFDGSDGSTDDYTAETGQTVSLEGTAQLDTAQKVFGTASLLLDGNSDYATVPDSDDWAYGTGDFTIDFWVRFASVSGTQYLYHQFDTTVNDQNYIVSNGAGYYIRFRDGGVTRGYYGCETTIAANTWYHLAFVRSGTTGYIFVNGVSQTLTAYTAYGSNTMSNISSVLAIGGSLNGNEHLNGWIEEFRISKGTARWISDFTPPTGPYGLVPKWTTP